MPRNGFKRNHANGTLELYHADSLICVFDEHGLAGEYYVKAHGAVGDGTTDDYAPIQSAIDAANAAGGGTVVLGAATYFVNTRLTTYDNVRLLGQGKSRSTIKAGAGVLTAVILGTAANSVSNFYAGHLAIDGNASALTGDVCGIQITDGAAPLIEHVRIHNVRDMGIALVGTPDAEVAYCEVYDTGLGGVNGHRIHLINGCHRAKIHHNRLPASAVSGSGGMGIRIGNDGDGSTDCEVSFNYIDNTNENLECIGITPTCDRAVVASNQALNGRDNNISVSADDCTVTGNIAVGANYHGIQINGDNCTVSGNISKNNGQNAGATRAGIHLNNVTGTVVTGNRCYDDQGEKTQDFGVKGSGAEGINYVTGNNFTGNGTSGKNGLSVSVVIANNVGDDL